jgi:hypothetical protein
MAERNAAFDSFVDAPPRLTRQTRTTLSQQKLFSSPQVDWQLLAALIADHRSMRDNLDDASIATATRDCALERFSYAGPAKNNDVAFTGPRAERLADLLRE